MKVFAMGVLVFILSAGCCMAFPCPDYPTDITADWTVRLSGSIKRIGLLKGTQLEGEVTRVANNLFNTMPNGDKAYIQKMMYATYCNAIKESSFNEKEKIQLLNQYNMAIAHTFQAKNEVHINNVSNLNIRPILDAQEDAQYKLNFGLHRMVIVIPVHVANQMALKHINKNCFDGTALQYSINTKDPAHYDKLTRQLKTGIDGGLVDIFLVVESPAHSSKWNYNDHNEVFRRIQSADISLKYNTLKDIERVSAYGPGCASITTRLDFEKEFSKESSYPFGVDASPSRILSAGDLAGCRLTILFGTNNFPGLHISRMSVRLFADTYYSMPISKMTRTESEAFTAFSYLFPSDRSQLYNEMKLRRLTQGKHPN